jgi:PP-loop superfamily ATP-utilizing enzyme
MIISKLEFSKKILLKCSIPAYAVNYQKSPIYIKDFNILLRFNKKNNYLSLIDIKDRTRQKISQNLKVKKEKITFLYKSNFEYDDYKLSSILTAIVIDDLEWYRNYKLEKILTC